MGIHENLRQIIDDYFSITGRPVSTMTVEEYAKFIEIAGNDACLPISGGRYCKEDKQISTFPAPSPLSKGAEKEFSENEQKIDKSHNTTSIPRDDSGISSMQQGNERPKTAGKPSKEEMLKIMRSVNS